MARTTFLGSISRILPDSVRLRLRSIYHQHILFPPIRFSGPFATWDDAASRAIGYDTNVIFEKTKRAALEVKEGRGVFERDSVVFQSPEYNFPLLSVCQTTAAIHHGELSVMDFGGALGSSYFQNRPLLLGINRIRWSVIEQGSYVEFGNKHISNHELKFYHSISSAAEAASPNLVVASAVLQYLPKPWAILNQLAELDHEMLLLDRMPVISTGPSLIAVQHVPKWIYPASYPCWFFSEQELIDRLGSRYILASATQSKDRIKTSIAPLEYKTYLFLKRGLVPGIATARI